MNSIKRWEQEEKYKEFHKENFEKVDKFSKRLEKVCKYLFRMIFIIDLILIAGIFIDLAVASINIQQNGGIFQM